MKLAEEGYYAISLTESWKNLKLPVLYFIFGMSTFSKNKLENKLGEHNLSDCIPEYFHKSGNQL